MQAWMTAAAQQVADSSPHMRSALPVVEGRVIHVDGDMIAYWAGGGEDMPIDVSRRIAANKIEAMREYAGAASVVLHLTAASSTKADRFMIATQKPYQGQRKSGRKPKNWGYLREWMEAYTGPAFRVKLWATREADDGLAFFAYHYNGQHVIATKDKDMRMLPGWHIDWDTMELFFVPMHAFDVVHKEKQYGHKWFWLQMLQGDTADNIPGLPKWGGVPCGEVKASKLLDGVETNDAAFDIVSMGYDLHYADGWQDAMLEQALLLWLRTDRHATFEDVYTVLPPSHFDAAMQRLKTRIKEKYDEAHKLTGQSPARQDAG
jgi:DNA polymerase-1